MKKRELVKNAADLNGIAPGTVADDLDHAVNRIIKALKNGQSARLPGLGTLTPTQGNPGKRWVFRRESSDR
jgi:nucleoid DNA-binding protein